MKVISKKILPFQEDLFFSPIRTKLDYAKLLVHSTRTLILNYDTKKVESKSAMKLIVDKMSRLFFSKDNKIFSISFPFNIILDQEDNIIDVTTLSGKSVDNKSISAVISILEDENFKINPSLIDFYIESDSIEGIGIQLLEEIIHFEPGYIRYDYDSTNENGRLHPLNHLDINYSSYSTYKLGLNDLIYVHNFENILNINTDCNYLDI